MNIGMLLNAPYPPDIRVRKEVQALQAAGNTVYLLCLRRKGEPYTEVAEGLHITRLNGGTQNVTLAFWDVVMSVLFIHPLFYFKLPAWIKKNKIAALHVHDLPLTGTALAVRKKCGVKVIADFHENYPDALGVWFRWKKNPLARLKNKLFMHPARWRKLEARAVHQADRIIAVVEEMKQRLIENYHTDPAKIIVVTNTESKTFIQQPLHPDIYAAHQGKFILAYAGHIGPSRGMDTAIEGMALLKGKPIVLVITGAGSAEVMQKLANMVNELGLQEQVFFYGYQPFSKFYSLMHFSNVNIIPLKLTVQTDNSAPNKLFQAMMAGRPLLVSSCTSLKRMIESTGAGLVFQHNNAQDFAEKVLTLYNDPQLCETLGKNGLKATMEGTLNWEYTQQYLIELYQSLR
jgi:glycosyltransferase involved in cell wall biosynthesis